jgi:hypothetical protein
LTGDHHHECPDPHGTNSGFTLGSEVDDKTAVARLEDGVLKIEQAFA